MGTFDPVASTTDMVGDFVGNASEIVNYAIGTVMLLAVVLVGAGYAWRTLKKHVTGGKL